MHLRQWQRLANGRARARQWPLCAPPVPGSCALMAQTLCWACASHWHASHSRSQAAGAQAWPALQKRCLCKPARRSGSVCMFLQLMKRRGRHLSPCGVLCCGSSAAGLWSAHRRPACLTLPQPEQGILRVHFHGPRASPYTHAPCADLVSYLPHVPHVAHMCRIP